MARGINKVIHADDKEKSPDEFELYILGNSIPEVSEKTEIPCSTLRFRFKKAGILRSRGEGVRLASTKGKLSGNKGTKRTFTPEWKKNIAATKQELGRIFADGISIKPNGYAEFTRGKHKGKSVHRVVAELWLNRDLEVYECVHHIDGDKLNNDIDNLAIMTRSGHARLHRREDELQNNVRERKKDGTWS